MTLPYPLMLQKSAREALSLTVKDHIVIIDEAHNLMDAVSGTYSVSITLGQLRRSRAQLGVYLQRFRNRLKGKNRVYVTQTVRLLDSLTTYLEKWSHATKDAEGIASISDLMAGKGVDQINLYKLTRYLHESKLARKVDGYSVFVDENEKGAARHHSQQADIPSSKQHGRVPVLTHIQNFLLSLMNPSAEGRFFYSKADVMDDTCLRYMLLDPTEHFREIVDEARAVILAGGTMSPVGSHIKRIRCVTSAILS